MKTTTPKDVADEAIEVARSGLPPERRDSPIAIAYMEMRLHCRAIDIALRMTERQAAVEEIEEVYASFAATDVDGIASVHLPRLLTALISIIAVEAYAALCEWMDLAPDEGYPDEAAYRARVAAAEAGDEDAQFEVAAYGDYCVLRDALDVARECTAVERIIRATLGPAETSLDGGRLQ